MILIGLGGNLPSPEHGPPAQTLGMALARMPEAGIDVTARSRWWTSPPEPPSDQSWFTNGVVVVQTQLSPAELLIQLQAIEAGLGRVRRVRNEARTIDLDLLAYGNLVSAGQLGPDLPHPRLHLRSFVLEPLAEVAPGWWHPGLRQTVSELKAALPPGSRAQPCIEF